MLGTGRVSVIARDGLHCYLCDRPIAAGDVELDHVESLARGGRRDLDNLRPTHRACNQAKGSRSLEQFDALVRARPTLKLARAASAFKPGGPLEVTQGIAAVVLNQV